jgi:hypothetical protein
MQGNIALALLDVLHAELRMSMAETRHRLNHPEEAE